MEKFNLDLSLVARLGGHSQPRTHRGKERFPGMTITYALIQMLEKAFPAAAADFVIFVHSQLVILHTCGSVISLISCESLVISDECELHWQVAEKSNLARIITKAKVFKLVTEGNTCVGCVYEKGGQNFQEFGPVILASGKKLANMRSSRNGLTVQKILLLLHALDQVFRMS